MKNKLVDVAETENFEIWDDKDNQLFMINSLFNNVTIGLDYEAFEELKECISQTEKYEWKRPMVATSRKKNK